MTTNARLDRRTVAARLLANRQETLVVTGLGSTTYDVAAAGDDDKNFYLWGAMGGAAMVGLGLALAQPKRPVMVITGDGEMLMGLGCFAAIAKAAPPNLTVVVFDNELYGETGAQTTHTAHGTDLAAVARACGLSAARTLTTLAEVDALAGDVARGAKGPVVAVVKIAPTEAPRVIPIRDGAYNKGRFRRALGLPAD
jgi:thiamine pyrophosphate-dependent acetolactate synthase large subunit-like protein